MKKHLKKGGHALIIFFALIGFFFTAVFIGMEFGLLNVRGGIRERNAFFTPPTNTASSTPPVVVQACSDATISVCAWNKTTEWEVVRGGLTKDKEIIKRVSKETGVPERLIASLVVPEQIRFFTSNREVFKRYFEPLKILGSLSQFSLGVSGIKEETALLIELHTQDPTSAFYPGTGMDSLIAYPQGVDQKEELYNRLTDAKNHYYSYLYTALFIKEIEAQWQRQGFTIYDKPDIIATLFNLGFTKSSPKVNPSVGGAYITTGGQTYTYGELGGLFYESNELEMFTK